MTIDEVIIILNKFIERYSKKEFDENSESPGIQAILKSRKEKCEGLSMAIAALKFKQYFDELYGSGLEIANWHLNGDLEPLDNFIDSALDQ